MSQGRRTVPPSKPLAATIESEVKKELLRKHRKPLGTLIESTETIYYISVFYSHYIIFFSKLQRFIKAQLFSIYLNFTSVLFRCGHAT